MKNKTRIDMLKDKAYKKHITEIKNAEIMYNNLIDTADDVFNVLIDEANTVYKSRLLAISNNNHLKNKEAHMTHAFKDHKASIDYAQLVYNEDLDEAREHFHEVIGYSNMIYREDLHIAALDDRVEGCAGPGGNDNGNIK